MERIRIHANNYGSGAGSWKPQKYRAGFKDTKRVQNAESDIVQGQNALDTGSESATLNWQRISRVVF